MQMCNCLTWYHSTPSSVLAGLLHDDTQPQDSDAFTQEEDLEFAQFLDDHLCSMASPHFGSKPLSSADFHSTPPLTTEGARAACLTDNDIGPELQIEHKSLAVLQQHPPCMTNGCSSSIKDVFRGPLSSISDPGADELNKFGSFDAQIKMGDASHSNLWQKPSNVPISTEGRLAYVKSELIRHKSSPADVLSRFIMEEGNGETVLHFGGPSKQNLGKRRVVNHVGLASSIRTFNRGICTSKTEDGKGVSVEAKIVTSPTDDRKNSLLRQNSSPAGLLSQISFGGMSSLTCTKLSSSALSENSSEEERRGGAYQAARFWGEIGYGETGLVHRKRGRESHSMHRLQSSEISFTNQKDPHAGSHAKMHRDGLVGMEVLCRVSAKRGCATHPRSIAERVRRTKINEGIRKLQDLMPNMEKQTNTVTMLDEAVEYVKSLQRQVQELSESRPKCNGRCKLKGNA